MMATGRKIKRISRDYILYGEEEICNGVYVDSFNSSYKKNSFTISVVNNNSTNSSVIDVPLFDDKIFTTAYIKYSNNFIFFNRNRLEPLFIQSINVKTDRQEQFSQAIRYTTVDSYNKFAIAIIPILPSKYKLMIDPSKEIEIIDPLILWPDSKLSCHILSKCKLELTFNIKPQ